MSNYETVIRLNVLSAGRNPTFWEQTTGSLGAGDPDFTGAPVNSGQGASMSDGQGSGYDVLFSQYWVELREDVSKRTVRIFSGGVVTPADTVTVSIDGNDVSFIVPGAATWATVVAGLVAALPGVAPALALVSFTDVTIGTTHHLLILGKAEAQYTIGLSVAGGGGTNMVARADPASCSARYFVYPRTTTASTSTHAPPTWALKDDLGVIDYRGQTDTARLAGYERGYMEIYNVAAAGDTTGTGGTIYYYDQPSVNTTHTGLRVFWGPCLDEA